MVKQLGISTNVLKESLEANALDGLLLARITTKTVSVRLLLFGNHQEEISFLVINSPFVHLVLGHPWLVKHSPYIDWKFAKVVS